MISRNVLKKAAARVDRISRAKRSILTVKRAADAASDPIDYIARRRKLMLILGSLVGAAYGSGIGSESGHTGRGALIGGLTGLGAAYASNAIRNWAGLDPIGSVVTTGKV